MTAHVVPEACESRFICLSFKVVTEFLYRLFNNDVKCGFFPLIEPLEDVFLEHRALPSAPQITAEAPVLSAK